jgi:5-formyltetrahydrofolate cyclo-ligase
MSSGTLKREKRRIRREVLERRDAVPADLRERWGERIAERSLQLPEVGAATNVMLFSSFGSEVPTGPLIERLRERGITVALPRIDDGDLVPVAFAPGDPVRATAFGVLEPIGPDTLDRSSLDVIGVPGVAFDRHGRRVGYGGGYYDRFLRDLAAFRVGIAFSLQVIEGRLPAGSFDLPVHAIVTEEETIRPDLTRSDLNSRSIS